MIAIVWLFLTALIVCSWFFSPTEKIPFIPQGFGVYVLSVLCLGPESWLGLDHKSPLSH